MRASAVSSGGGERSEISAGPWMWRAISPQV
jgi:hypothetical protein